MSANKILKHIKDHKIEYVDLRFTDPRGKLQHLTMDSTIVDDGMLNEGVFFDGSSIAGWKAINESDMILKPDLERQIIDPFTSHNTLILFCDVLDAVKKKSRKFMLIVGFVFALGTLYLIYIRIFTGIDVGVILFKYSDNYVFHKRSIKRSCFFQIFLFALNGLWINFKDKKMEMMMFATGNIYRETGTASKYVEDTQHSMQMRRETADSRV